MAMDQVREVIGTDPYLDGRRTLRAAPPHEATQP